MEEQVVFKEVPVDLVETINRQEKVIRRLRKLLFEILETIPGDSELGKEIWMNLKSEFEGE